jgi:MoxR-like ATPase
MIRGPVRQFVERRAQDARLQPAAHQHVGARFARDGIEGDADRVVGACGHQIADIGAEDEGLGGALAGAVHAHRHERRVGDADPNLFGGRYKIGLAVGVLPQDRGEHAYETFPRDAAVLVSPGAVAHDLEADVAAMGRIPPFDWKNLLFGRIPKPLERGDHLLQGRGRLAHVEPSVAAAPPEERPRLISAPIRKSFTPMSNVMDQQDADALVAEAEAAGRVLARAREEIGRAVFGQERVVELTLAAVLSGGHALLVGAPGLAKTRLVAALATVLGLPWARVQFTPDLMPADILGSEVLEQDQAGRRAFRFVKGPIFTSLLMADEINRASPRTQSALLQAMQERHVTIAGQRYDVPEPFHVLATQNPIEHEGAYPLPEAQLDRFLLQIDVPYPDAEIERRILIETTGLGEDQPEPVLNAQQLIRIQQLVRAMPMGEKVLEAIIALVRSARPGASQDARVNQHVAWGPGPRAGQALMLAVRARALLRGRLAPSIDDVIALARPALVHRMQLSFGARAEGLDIDTLVDELAEQAA